MTESYPNNEAATVLLNRRFRIRTVLIPVLFMALHWLMINIAAVVYLIGFLLIRGSGLPSDPMTWLEDPALLNQILTEQYPVISVFYALGLIPIYLIFLHVSRQNDARILFKESVRVSHLLPAMAIMIGSLGITNLWFSLLHVLAESQLWIDRMLTDYVEQAEAFSPAAGYIWLILGIVIMAPIAEELLFRGIIQGELRKAMPEWLAIIIQAILFALFHLQPIQISYVLIPGLLLGMAYAWSRSIWVPIIMHILFNFLGSVVPALVGGDEVLGSIVVITQIAFILVGGLAVVYFYMKRRTGPELEKV